LGSGAGVSSTSEWLPVVQGGMVRNSSKVRTRGLQHFQPEERDLCQYRRFWNDRDWTLRGAGDWGVLPFCPSWKTGGPG
jgi:hypothetical protein